MRSSLRVSLLIALVALVALLAAAPARADDTSAAREHYQKGTSYYDLGRYAEAVREFEAAYQIKNDPALLYNLAQSHRLAGNSDQALHFYRTYLRRVPKAPNRTEIEGRISQLEQLVAQKNAAQTTPPNVTMPPGSSPTQPSEPPPTANPPAMTTTPPPATTPPLATGTAPAISTSATPAPAGPPPDGERGRKLKKWGVITMIVGGACILIGAAEGVRAVGAASEINDAAKNGGTFDPAIESRGKSAQAGEAVFLTLGVVVGAVGGGLYYYGRKEEAAAHVSVMPVASANAMGALMRVTF